MALEGKTPSSGEKSVRDLNGRSRNCIMKKKKVILVVQGNWAREKGADVSRGREGKEKEILLSYCHNGGGKQTLV